VSISLARIDSGDEADVDDELHYHDANEHFDTFEESYYAEAGARPMLTPRKGIMKTTKTVMYNMSQRSNSDNNHFEHVTQAVRQEAAFKTSSNSIELLNVHANMNRSFSMQSIDVKSIASDAPSALTK
jgi:hypothetical protein